MTKLPIGDFVLGVGVFEFPIPHPKNTKSQFQIIIWVLYHQLVMKLPIGDFELGIGVFRIGDWVFPNPKNTKSQFKITNWSFYQKLVISSFRSLISNQLVKKE